MKSIYGVVALLALAHVSTSLRRHRVQSHALKEASNSSQSTGIDVWMCDKMCMQCPDGRNILIQRQKSGKANFVGGVAGAFSFGWGMTAVTQLAGCNKIGFQFWQDRALLEEQPLETEAFMGVMFVTSGLEKLKEQTTGKTAGDEEALEACERLTDTYAWSALRGALSFESSYTVQDRQARKCLSHSMLCGRRLGIDEAEVELQTARWNPFTHESMCEAPPEKDASSVEQEEIGEFGSRMGLPSSALESLSARSPEVQRIVMLKWPEEDSTNVDEFLSFTEDVSEVVTNLPEFVDKWKLDDECLNELTRLPIKVQKIVLSDFSGGGDVKASFLAFLKSQLAARVAAQAPHKFIEALQLDDECLQALMSSISLEIDVDVTQWHGVKVAHMSQSLSTQRAVMTKYEPPVGSSDLKKAFLDYLALVALIKKQISQFIHKWDLDEDCLEELSILPPEIQKYVIENFKHDDGDVGSSFKVFLKSAPWATEDDGLEEDTNVLVPKKQDSIDAGRDYVKKASEDADVVVKEAGQSLEKFVKEENPNGDFTLGDDEIGLRLGVFCTKKCKDDQNPKNCKDGCCWKTCVSYKNTPGPKCTQKCSHGK